VKTINFDEIYRYQFRKPPPSTEKIRVIQIGQYDISACCGTHVESTGEIGLMIISKFERYKGGLRISFVAGKRCLQYQQEIRLIHTELLSNLTIKLSDLPKAVGRLREENQEKDRINKMLQAQLFKFESKKLWEGGEKKYGINYVFSTERNRGILGLRLLAKHLRKHQNTFVFLASDDMDKTYILCTQSDQQNDVDACILIKEVTQRFGGKGGGSGIVAEGRIPITSHEEIFGFVRTLLGI
jgi:alanyl-tRNA synthetase